MIDDSWKQLVVAISAHARPGETLFETYEREKRERDVQIYDHATVKHARDSAREMRIMFAAAVLSQPDQRLRISTRNKHALSGPESFELRSYEDMRTEETIFYVERR